MTEQKALRYETGTAIVAGGSGGIGRAICKRLALSGSNIVLTYNCNRDSAETTAKELQALGRRSLALRIDLRDAASVAEAVKIAAKEFGNVHTAIYAAGPYINMRHVSRLEPELFEKTVSTDVFGAYNFLHTLIPELRRAKGVMVALGTPAIRRTMPKDVMSFAPKAAIEAIVRAIAAEEGRYGVRANLVGVGVITDGMYQQLLATGDFDEAFLKATEQVLALRRLGRADDIANAVDFLVSDAAAYITGQSLMVDGGYAL
ncbi:MULTISPECIES: SDR family oxidoreductase [unclassified Bradyrhizobium]|uniref:SDR family NAD(P)-dependent oxidoreductase n=1 Tax=unclassified Bradyrhizobium TaxID=2631580 RepID=UPI001FFBA3B0|nr:MULTISPECIES: SDR family oxidoreductase [unclassified Bradyrhizobium]MCK1715941.1 SDR family oxidoreductase [Bradyrhizobium sp. 143]MCK1725739.1 SDR family oxidoreductase [Bradyrhizobium sp. 142]